MKFNLSPKPKREAEKQANASRDRAARRQSSGKSRIKQSLETITPGTTVLPPRPFSFMRNPPLLPETVLGPSR